MDEFGADPPDRDSYRTPTLAIQFQPHPGLLTQTREFVRSFCGTFVRDPDAVYRLTIAAHELLENSIKYSSDGTTNMTIECHTGERKSRISIRAENRATPERVRAVRDAIETLRDADDPFQLYCDLIKASVDRNAHSGLGLARICVEAACALDYRVTGDQLAIFAETYVDHGGLE
ncbi:MAG TPA: ATP-binding protein [Polyangiaceae bacterium]|nr:ATP-binding protein [Polyangiaceae bacterium]